MSQYNDIILDGWVSSLPPRLRALAVLARLDRPIGVWLLFLPGLWSLCLTARGSRLAALTILFAIGSVAMRGAGCVVNDIWDRDVDRLVTRTAGRPLASGMVGLRGAAILLAALLALSALVLLALPRLAQLLAVGSLGLVGLYPLAKRVTWWPQAMLGVTFGWGALLGYAAGAGRLDGIAAALYGAAFCWILGYDTIYAHQDREDDARVGVRSTARLFARHTRRFLGICYAATVLLLMVAGVEADLAAPFYAMTLVGAGLLAWQIWRIDIDDPALCLRLFKANRDVGLVVAAGLLAGRL